MRSNIYSQEWQHQGAYIVLDTGALATLRRVLDDVVRNRWGEFDVFACDGEAFPLRVILLDDDATWLKLAEPYPNAITGDQSGRVWPWELKP